MRLLRKLVLYPLGDLFGLIFFGRRKPRDPNKTGEGWFG